MKKLTFATALLGLLALTGCGGTGSKGDLLPVFTWEGNPRYAELEIGKNMDGTVTAEVPGGVAVLTVTATIPTKLVGMAEQMIGISANKQGDVLVFDLIQDKTANSALASKGFTSVSSGSQSFKMDFAKLLDAVIGTAEVPNGSKFSFKVHLEDRSGNKKDFSANFRWTAAPSFNLAEGTNPYYLEIGTTKKLVVTVDVPGKIETFTVTFGGSNPSEDILNYIKKRTSDGSAVVDLINDSKATTALKLPANLAKATSGKLDFSELVQGWSYDATEPSITVLKFHVEDVLGKDQDFEVQLVKE